MKKIAELRYSDLNVDEVASSVKYFNTLNIDWNVFLPTLNTNLQRDFVWSITQKRELIWSMLYNRHIPHCAMINIIDSNNNDLFQIIDGKQRLSTMLDFLNNKFSIIIDDIEYYYKDLPDDYKLAISNFKFRYYIVNEDWNKRITDQQKINWFKRINFAGTPQDIEHLNKLK